MTKKKAIFFLVLIVIIGSALRSYKFHYGITGSYVADTQTVSEAMDIGNAINHVDPSVFLKPVKYPLVLPYIILFLHGSYFLAGKILGTFKTSADFFRFIALNQSFSFLAARSVSIISGILIVILAFFSSKVLASRFGSPKPYLAAVISSFFASFGLLLFQFSRLERPHIVAGFFVLLAYFFYLKFLEKPAFKTGLLVGVGVGLAAGTLQSGILTGIFLLVPLVFYLVGGIRDYRKILSGLLSAAVLLFLSYPFLFLAFKKTTGLSDGKLDVSFSGATHNVFPFGGQGFYKIIHHIFWYEPALFILFLLGLTILLYRGQFKKLLMIDKGASAIFFLVFFIVFGVYNFTLPRYVIPIVLVMTVFSGILAVEFLGGTSNSSWPGKIKTLFLVLLILFSLAQASRLTFLLAKQDTRDLAASWLLNNTNKNDAILATSPLAINSTKESILKNQRLGGAIGRRDELLLSVPDESYPRDARNILRSWGLKTKHYSRFIRENKIRYIVLSNENGFIDSQDPLFLFAGENFKLKASFSPFMGRPGFLFSPFPGDFHNPVRELWGINRIGPEVRIYSNY